MNNEICSLNVKESVTLQPIIYPPNATDKRVDWSVNNNVCNIVGNTLIANEEGTCIVTCTTVDGGYSASCTIKVYTDTTPSVNKPPRFTGLLTLTVNQGEACDLRKGVSATDPEDGIVEFIVRPSYIDTNIVGQHTATYTAVDSQGLGTEETRTITVKSKAPEVIKLNRISLNKNTHKMSKNQTVKLVVSYDPTNATNKRVTWSISKGTSCEVDNKGLVTSLSVGESTVLCTSEDGNKQDTCVITVEDVEVQNTPPYFEGISDTTIKVGESINLREGIRCLDEEDGELDYTVYPERIDNRFENETTIEYSAMDRGGLITRVNRKITVVSNGGGGITPQPSVNTPPYFQGVTDKIINVGDYLDLRYGVKALDEQDGILDFTVEPDTIDTRYPGSEVFEYKAMDSKGLMTVKERTIIIKSVPGGGGGVDPKPPGPPSENIPVESVGLNVSKKNMMVGDSYRLVATITPNNATNQNINWSIIGGSSCTVNNGLVYAVKKGMCTVLCSSEDGNKQASCTIVVNDNSGGGGGSSTNKPPYFTGISNLTVDVGTPVSLYNGISAIDPEDGEIGFTVFPKTINVYRTGTYSFEYAATDSGGLTTRKTRVITIKEVGEVNPPTPGNIPVESVSLNKTKHSMNVGDTFKLTPMIIPSNATNRNVTWTSSNTGCCTVNGGAVKAVGEGVSTIVCKTVDSNRQAYCTIVVKDTSKPVPPGPSPDPNPNPGGGGGESNKPAEGSLTNPTVKRYINKIKVSQNGYTEYFDATYRRNENSSSTTEVVYDGWGVPYYLALFNSGSSPFRVNGLVPQNGGHFKNDKPLGSCMLVNGAGEFSWDIPFENRNVNADFVESGLYYANGTFLSLNFHEEFSARSYIEQGSYKDTWLGVNSHGSDGFRILFNTPALNDNYGYWSNDGGESCRKWCHTFAHEFNHSLGFDDELPFRPTLYNYYQEDRRYCLYAQSNDIEFLVWSVQDIYGVDLRKADIYGRAIATKMPRIRRNPNEYTNNFDFPEFDNSIDSADVIVECTLKFNTNQEIDVGGGVKFPYDIYNIIDPVVTKGTLNNYFLKINEESKLEIIDGKKYRLYLKQYDGNVPCSLISPNQGIEEM